MADLPPEQSDVPAKPVPAPQLLVMPPTEAIPSMVWPGTEGETAWAIPVQIPSGTRGYALFVPMVPAAGAPVTAPAVLEKTAAPAAVEKGTAAEKGVVAPAAVEKGTAAEKGVVAPAAVERETAAEKAVEKKAAEPIKVAEPLVSTPPAPPLNPQAYRPHPQARPWGGYEQPPTTWQTFRAKNWPGPKEAKGWAVPAGVLTGALGFLLFLPLDRVGIGWFLAWLSLALGVGFAVHKSPDLPRRERLARSGWAVAALALMLVPAFRNAWWLITFSVLGAIGCTALAIAGGRRVRSILFSLLIAPWAAFAGIPWVRKHLKGSRNPGMAGRVVFSIALTTVVLLVFGALLSSADVAFSALLDDAIPDFEVGSIFEWILLAVTGGLLAVSGIYTLTAPPQLSGMDTEGKGRFGLIEWAPACAALVLLFGGFVAVQFTVLFGGRTHVLETPGLTYAQYARSGFWQLVAVTLLSLALLAALSRWAKRDTGTERVMLRVLLGLICALSVVIVASALFRMWKYQQVYSFTGERIFVMASELLLGVIFVMIALAGVKWKGAWIPATTVGLAVLMLLGLAVLDPEGYVARSNAKRYADTGKIDAWYLRALSADATPALIELPDPVRRCTLSWIAQDLKDDDPWYAWNLGRQQAREALKELPPGSIGNQKDCRRADQFDLPKTRR